MTGAFKLNNQEKEYNEYLNKYVIITILPQGSIYYGKLKSFEKRKAILSPYRGDRINNGILENCLLSEESSIDLGRLNIKIEETSKELIEKWCELETINYFIREIELREKYRLVIDNSKK